MHKIITLLILAAALSVYTEKFLFKSRQSCIRCIDESAQALRDGKRSFECRPKSSARPGGENFIMMRYEDSRTETVSESFEERGTSKRRRYRVSSQTGGQHGLAEDEVSLLCPKHYRLIASGQSGGAR